MQFPDGMGVLLRLHVEPVACPTQRKNSIGSVSSRITIPIQAVTPPNHPQKLANSQHVVTVRQVSDVSRSAKGGSDLLGCLDTTDGKQTVAGLFKRARNRLRSFGFALGADDRSLPFLLGLKMQRK